MRKLITVVVVALLLIGAALAIKAALGKVTLGTDEAVAAREAWSQQLIAVQTQLAELMEGVTDEASARAAAPKLEVLARQYHQVMARWESLPRVARADEERIAAAYTPQVKQAHQRVAEAVERMPERVRNEPAFLKARQRLQPPPPGPKGAPKPPTR